MERNANESFADYKERRAIANRAVERINEDSRGGGSQSSRARQREFAPGFHVGIKGTACSNRTSMGAGIAASAAAMRATPARMRAHMAYLAKIANRKAERAAANDFTLAQAA